MVFSFSLETALAQTAEPETVIVIGAPLPGSKIDPDKIAGDVEVLSMPALTGNRGGDVIPNAVATQLSNVSINDEQGSQFQPDFVYRGFEASPLSGIAGGVAVYQDGVRLNESFGDNVNWDLVPEFAVQTFTLESNDPAFGLNAIGGAVSLTMKSGLDYHGGEAELSGGSFGNVSGNAEYGVQFGNFGIYLGLGGLHDDGYRYHSPATLRQLYGDLAWQSGRFELHLSQSAAFNDIAAAGPTPVQMLAQDIRSVFTHPQMTRNEMELTELHGTWRSGRRLSISFTAYYRHFLQHLVDGNTTNVAYCGNDPAQLCLEGNYDYPGDALYDVQGDTVPASVLASGATPGETDFTQTDTNSVGSAMQASVSAPVLGHGNRFVAGASVDHGMTNYQAYGELGNLLETLEVRDVGVIIDQAKSPTAQPPIEAPVDVNAGNTYLGAYAADVLDVTQRLSWTVSARLNIADISLNDLLGSSLNGEQSFTHLNPGTGFTYKISDSLTAYAGYSESNRAPTPGEMSCADPAAPCLLDAFLVADPPLRQVVSQDFEAGLRGKVRLAQLPGTFSWKAEAWRVDAQNDILLLATQVNGFGYFENAGVTRREGADFHLDYRDDRWKLSASYSYLNATFRNDEVLSSNSPAADASGDIFVHPGDQIPMNPAHRLTLSGDYNLSPSWSVGADWRLQSGEYLVGDESNQEPKLPGFTTINLRTDYQLTSQFDLFGEIENVVDTRYYTYGTFAQLDHLPPNFNLTNPRTYSPAAPRVFLCGLRATWN
ncbi:MAG TPA: TonB-dependent receptor [Rhizomicrobium sp.]|nr:TonB-dependent receptor [Rhizomicrobium sp.]